MIGGGGGGSGVMVVGWWWWCAMSFHDKPTLVLVKLTRGCVEAMLGLTMIFSNVVLLSASYFLRTFCTVIHFM